MIAPRIVRALVAIVAAVGLVRLTGCVTAPPATDPLTAKSVGEVRNEPVDRAVRTATVRIRNRGCGTLATGSGVVLGADLIATNRHVVDGASQLEINTWDGRTLQVDVASVASDTDLALVRVNGSLPAAIQFADDSLVTGDKVTIAGYPEGRRLSLLTGLVRGTGAGPFGEDDGVIYVDAAVRPGNSGGPAANSEGELAGLVYAGWVEGDVAAIIPASRLQRLHDEGGFAAVEPCAAAQSPAEAAVAAGYGQSTLPPPPSQSAQASAATTTTALAACPSGQPTIGAARDFTVTAAPAGADGSWATTFNYDLTNPTTAGVFARVDRLIVYDDGSTERNLADLRAPPVDAGQTTTINVSHVGGNPGNRPISATLTVRWQWADRRFVSQCPPPG